MNVKTPTDQAKETIAEAQKQARITARDARKQARSTVRTARKQARRQLIQARIAAARARTGARTKASGASAKAVGAAGAVGLAVGYFLDPESGRRRRNQARDRVLAVIHRRTDRKPAPNDQALAERVKSEIFQPADAPKGSVNVNVENGVVYLRGEVKRPDQIRKLVEEAGSVDGVAAVENLLHTP